MQLCFFNQLARTIPDANVGALGVFVKVDSQFCFLHYKALSCARVLGHGLRFANIAFLRYAIGCYPWSVQSAFNDISYIPLCYNIYEISCRQHSASS